MSRTMRTRDGPELFRQDWPSDGARGTIVIVHGLGEHVARYARVAANGLCQEVFNEPERAEVLSVLGVWLDTLSFPPPTRSPR